MFTLAGISGSLRKASTNTGLLRCAQKCCESAELSAKVRFLPVDISDVPLYNADVEAQGFPPSVQRLMQSLEGAHALVLACPEYNYSMTPVLKNALDWASRAPQNAVLANKRAVFFGAGGMMGTSRAQYHLRQSCVRLELYPLNQPEGFFNAFQGGFDAEGTVVSPEIAAHIHAMLLALVAELER